MSSPKLKFADGERVFCYHGPLLYEAKCLKAELKDVGNGKKEPRYQIHYNGWKKSYDEWVPEDRVLKYNETNLQKQKELIFEAQPKKAKARERALSISAETSSVGSAGKKRGQEETGASSGPKKKRQRVEGQAESDDDPEYNEKAEVKLEIPEELKGQLIDDWDFVTRQKKLVPLPRKPTVADVLERYKEHRIANKPTMSKGELTILGEVVHGLRVYFDQALGTLLLYRFERPQYGEVVEKYKDLPRSSVYGPEHLLRLFVKLPTLLAHVNMEEELLQVLLQYLTDFLGWLEKNRQEFFLPDYDNATPEYCRMATS
eukprot:Colp12_sorted_trinity150504_noHs@24346